MTIKDIPLRIYIKKTVARSGQKVSAYYLGFIKRFVMCDFYNLLQPYRPYLIIAYRQRLTVGMVVTG